jgi:hypothetical protein
MVGLIENNLHLLIDEFERWRGIIGDNYTYNSF